MLGWEYVVAPSEGVWIMSGTSQQVRVGGHGRIVRWVQSWKRTWAVGLLVDPQSNRRLFLFRAFGVFIRKVMTSVEPLLLNIKREPAESVWASNKDPGTLRSKVFQACSAERRSEGRLKTCGRDSVPRLDGTASLTIWRVEGGSWVEGGLGISV